MPFPLAAAIAGGSSILSGVLGNSAISQQNEANRQFSREMYTRQRADALADRDFENNYNSPAEQMKRLKAGGLNPNLVYGNGAAQVQSTNTRPSKADVPHQEAQQFGFLVNAAMAAFDAVKTQAQTNLLEQQRKTAESLEYLNKARQSFTDKQWDLTEEERKALVRRNHIGEHTIQADIERPKLQNTQIAANTAYTIAQNIRANVLAGQSIQESLQRIATGKSQVKLNEATAARLRILMRGDEFKNKVSELEAKLAKTGAFRNEGVEQGINKLIMRMINEIFDVDY